MCQSLIKYILSQAKPLKMCSRWKEKTVGSGSVFANLAVGSLHGLGPRPANARLPSRSSALLKAVVWWASARSSPRSRHLWSCGLTVPEESGKCSTGDGRTEGWDLRKRPQGRSAGPEEWGLGRRVRGEVEKERGCEFLPLL